MNIQKIKGTKDYYNKTQQQMDFVVSLLEKAAKQYGYGKITFPTIEKLELFKRTAGESSDIVSKEMFSFLDRKDRELALRPEGTASATRLVLENKLVEQGQRFKAFYTLPMYRYERPQKGRQREFLQFGIENYGDSSWNSSVEIIQLVTSIMKSLEISNYVIKINSIGSDETRATYITELKKYFKGKELSADSKLRIENNVLRILDSKDEGDRALLKDAPSIKDYLSTEETESFEKISSSLKELGINVETDYNLVRGLDYYNDFVFEVISTDENMGSQNTILGGGRYDNLVSQLDDSKSVPAVGFALGIDRLVITAEDFINKNIKQESDVYLVAKTEEALSLIPWATEQLIKDGYNVTTDTRVSSFSKQWTRAQNLEVKYIVELEDKNLSLKEVK